MAVNNLLPGSVPFYVNEMKEDADRIFVFLAKHVIGSDMSFDEILECMENLVQAHNKVTK